MALYADWFATLSIINGDPTIEVTPLDEAMAGAHGIPDAYVFLHADDAADAREQAHKFFVAQQYIDQPTRADPALYEGNRR